MERVTGIGGFFFRTTAPKDLARWYQDHLGVTLTPTDYDSEPWRQEAGPTVFQPFPGDTTCLGRPEQMWMVNFRVRNPRGVVAQLEAVGVTIEVDPEGNPIHLWESIRPSTPGT